jgi:hypothetical protein
MFFAQWRRVFAPILLSLLLFVSACSPKQASRYDQVQQETTQRGAAPSVAKTAEQGATFNQFFPGSFGSYRVVPAQEKKGFAEYKVNQDGKNVAVLSISDTTSVPAAAAKYQQSTFQISGYPAVEQGTMATGILVNDRYQVKVLSRDPSFTKDDRAAWIQKVDLRGLAKLPPATITLSPQPAAPSIAPAAPTSQPALSPQPAA